jgi:hypothetical protein
VWWVREVWCVRAVCWVLEVRVQILSYGVQGGGITMSLLVGDYTSRYCLLAGGGEGALSRDLLEKIISCPHTEHGVISSWSPPTPHPPDIAAYQAMNQAIRKKAEIRGCLMAGRGVGGRIGGLEIYVCICMYEV